MPTSVDHDKNQLSITKTNPIYDMSLSKVGLSSIQSHDRCFYFITVYLILQTALNAFLLYKVFTPQSSLSNPLLAKQTSNLIPLDRDFQTLLKNNSEEMKNLKSRVLGLQSQVDGLYGDGGQLHRLSYMLNSSTQRLEGQLNNIRLRPGLPGVKGQPGEKGAKGGSGVPGPVGPKGGLGPKGKKGDSGMPGYPGISGHKGAKGDRGWTGNKGAAGPRGYKGYKGSSGRSGPKGQKGEKGYMYNVPSICRRC